MEEVNILRLLESGIDAWLIDGLHVAVLTTALLFLFSKKTEKRRAYALYKWLILSFAIVKLFFFLNNDFITSHSLEQLAISYKIRLGVTYVLPFLLFLKRFSNHFMKLLLIAFISNTLWLSERYVIIITSIHRNYLTNSWDDGQAALYFLYYILLKGLILGLIVFAFSIYKKKPNAVHNNVLDAI